MAGRRRGLARRKAPSAALLAATVDAIAANDTRPAEFIYDNLALLTNLSEAADRHQISRFF